MSRIVDLSHPVEEQMPNYPGRLAPLFGITEEATVVASEQPGSPFLINRFGFDGDLGTHLDAPHHVFPTGLDVASLPLDRLANLPGVVVNISRQPGRAIGPAAFTDLELAGRAVLLRTDWSVRWSIPSYWRNAPYLTAEGAAHLVAQRVALVGIDCGSIDDRSNPHKPAHTLLLAADIPLIGQLTNIAVLGNDFFRFFAAPIALRGAACFPVRAFAIIEG